ncbi:MAG: hypothetical protein O6763_04380, partial [Gammaproteobacteria bacterium]|nr:hypothetical protein [Gammaproteobacteria bacterium]
AGVLACEPVANVLFAHTPFLICTLTYFTIYGNAGIFVLFSGFAMAASLLPCGSHHSGEPMVDRFSERQHAAFDTTAY